MLRQAKNIGWRHPALRNDRCKQIESVCVEQLLNNCKIQKPAQNPNRVRVWSSAGDQQKTKLVQSLRLSEANRHEDDDDDDA